MELNLIDKKFKDLELKMNKITKVYMSKLPNFDINIDFGFNRLNYVSKERDVLIKDLYKEINLFVKDMNLTSNEKQQLRLMVSRCTQSYDYGFDFSHE